MGCEPSAIEESKHLSDLREHLKQLSQQLNQLEKDQFSSIDEMNSLPSAQQISSLQEEINESLRVARREVRNCTEKSQYEIRERELNELTKQSNALYAKNASIIKSKLKEQLKDN